MTHLSLPFLAHKSIRFQSIALALMLLTSASSQAIDFGPEGMFSLTGFAKAEAAIIATTAKSFPLRTSKEFGQMIWL